MNFFSLQQLASTLMRLLTTTAVFLPAIRAQDTAPKPTEHPFLWRIEGEVPTYLFGTFHFPDARITTLHPEVEQAIEKCDALFTELPMDSKTVGQGTQVMMLPPGKRLADVVPREVLQRLEAFC